MLQPEDGPHSCLDSAPTPNVHVLKDQHQTTPPTGAPFSILLGWRKEVGQGCLFALSFWTGLQRSKFSVWMISHLTGGH
jgi:hypothetical protein